MPASQADRSGASLRSSGNEIAETRRGVGFFGDHPEDANRVF
jgi:hypothetical protein